MEKMSLQAAALETLGRLLRRSEWRRDSQMGETRGKGGLRAAPKIARPVDSSLTWVRCVPEPLSQY